MNKKKRLSNRFLRLGAFCGSLTSALLANALDISTDVTISSSETNVNYLNQNITILENGSLTYSDYVPSQTQSITITNNGELTFNVSDGNKVTLVANSAVLTLNGSQGFTKTGAGILQTFTADNKMVFAYDSGAVITISEGTFRNGEWLKQDWSNNKADMVVNATLDLWDGGNGSNGVMIDALSGSGTITSNATGNPGIFVVGVDNGSGNFTGKITEKASVISIEKRGSGLQILSGDNVYSGKTTVSAGTLQIGNGGKTGDVGTGNVTVKENASLAFNFDAISSYSSDAAIANSGSIAILGGSVTLTNLANSNTGSVSVSSGAAYTILNRSALDNVTVEDGGFLLLRVSETDATAWTVAQIATARSQNDGILYGAYADANSVVTADALLSGNGPLYLAGDAAGRFNFTSANADFTNGMTVFSGTAALTASATINPSCLVTVAAAGTFAYDLGAGTTTDVVNVIAGDGALAILSGTVRFTASSPKSGSSFIQTANVTVADGATLLFTDTVAPRPSITSTITAQDGGKVRFESSSYSSIGHDTNHSLAFTTAGRLILAGEGTFEFAGGGTTAILPGNGAARASISLANGGWMDVVEGSNLVFGGYSANIDWTNNYGSLNIAEANSQVSLWDGNQITIDNLTGSGIIESGAIRLGIANNENSEKYGVANHTAEFSGIIRDNIVNNNARAASLVKVGTGTQILSGNNTYSGKTTVSAGTLQIGNGGETGSLGSGSVEVQYGAVLQFNKSTDTTLSNSNLSATGTVRNMKSTLNLGSADDPYSFSTTSATFTADANAKIQFNLADAAQKTSDVFNGAGTVSFVGNTSLNASEAIFNMNEGGRVVFDGGSVTAPIYSDFGTLAITNDTVWNIANHDSTWSKTVYSNGNGYITPTSVFTSSNYLGEDRNVDSLINNTSNDSVRANGLPTYSAASYRAYVEITEETTLDLTGSYDDYAGIFAMKILDENGALLENPEWQTLLGYGEKCARVNATGVVLSPGYYLIDARVADVAGNAFANNNSILDPTGKQLGLGIRLNNGSLTGNTYYSLTIDENGFIGDESLGLHTGTPTGRDLVLGTQNFDLPEGTTLTISNPIATNSVTMTANVTGSGTLALENTSGENALYVLSGSSVGNLSVGDDVTLKLSKDAMFELTGDYSQGNVNFLVDLTGITEDFGWFTNVKSAEGLSENTTFSFISSDDQMLPVELTFFNRTDLTNEQWAEMVDFSQLDGILNVANIFVDGNGMLHLTVGDTTALPEPASWFLLGCGLAALGVLRRQKKN